ncbi:unnamed protein product [Somion occarium]|uniref:RNA polymerase II assembly factor Rtp1 C-terminal domain-containing protein n=1 Tax=Somion occarium TaxID=3059160 RepID=A0ABP1DWF6_9APHY
MQSPELVSTIAAGAHLAGSSRTEATSDLKSVLTSRLTQYEQTLGRSPTDRSDKTLEEVQLETASEALHVVSLVQILINRPNDKPNETQETSTEATPQDGYMIGTRDLAYMRTLLSITVKWGLEPLLQRVTAGIPSTMPVGARKSGVQVIDLTTVPENYKLLVSLIDQLLGIILPSGVSGPIPSTHISVLILDNYLPDLFKPCITLGWLPKSQATESVMPVDHLRSVVIHLISILPVSKSINALTCVLTDSSMLPYVRKTCSFLLGRQLLRPHGVQGLFIGIFGEEEESGETAPLEKLEHVSRLLQAVPKGIQEADYYKNITSQVVAVLSSVDQTMPSAHKRAAAFTLSRFLGSEANQKSNIASRILLPMLQRPFLQVTRQSSEFIQDSTSQEFSPSKALSTIQTLLINTDPSPTLISSLLTPIIPSLYSLLSTLEEHRTSDPALKMTVSGLLSTWGRLVGTEEGIASIWLVIEGEGGYWKVDVAGEVTRIEESENRLHSLSLFTPEDVRKAEEAGEFDADANILHLRPDPVHFVRYLKSIDRPDVTSDIFVKLLEAYRGSKGTSDSDPMRTLLYLQIVMQIQSQLSSDDSSMNILKKPGHILTFIKHALETATAAPVATSAMRQPKLKSSGVRMEDLRIVEEEEPEIEEADSDNEAEAASDVESGEDDMTATAVNLLLSILEANPDLSIQTTPILDEMFDLLDRLAKTGPENIKPLAREARMVLIARLASSSTPSASAKSRRTPAEESAQETYQKALKLLQDPLLPVRAHGLLLLRQLVSSRSTKEGKLEPPAIDRALIPGILSIFLQSLQDDDSYIFLNAVQGLSAMVDGFGKDTLKGLLDLYAQGLEGVGGTAMTKHDVDQRTRIGEALGQVIRRCADALPVYADVLVPPLFRIVRTSYLPTILRTSALSLLAQCANTNTLALLPYTTELIEAMIDLLQIESVPVKPSAPHAGPEKQFDMPAEKETSKATVDTQPTAANSKFPPLRRAALYFLSMLTRAYIEQMSDVCTRVTYILPAPLVRRAKLTVGYVAVTDEDSVVRVMAKEVLEGFDGIDEGMLGI